MPRFSPEADAYGWAWGVVNSAAGRRASTAEVFQAVRDEAARLELPTPPGMFQAVTELRTVAVKGRVGAETFGKADPGAMFTRSMAPEDINARGLADQALFPEYLVRFDMDVADDLGNITTRTVTIRDTWTPDMTVGDVTEAVNQSAQGLANDYGVTLVGVGNLRPVSI